MAPDTTSGPTKGTSANNVSGHGGSSSEVSNNRERRSNRSKNPLFPTVLRAASDTGPSNSKNAHQPRSSTTAKGTSPPRRSPAPSPSPHRPNPNAYDRGFTLDDEITPGLLVRNMHPRLLQAMGLAPSTDLKPSAHKPQVARPQVSSESAPQRSASASSNTTPPNTKAVWAAGRFSQGNRAVSSRDLRRTPSVAGSDGPSMPNSPSPPSGSSGIASESDEPLSRPSSPSIKPRPKRFTPSREAKTVAQRVLEPQRPESGSSGISAGSGSKSPTPSPPPPPVLSRRKQLSSQQAQETSDSRLNELPTNGKGPQRFKLRPYVKPKTSNNSESRPKSNGFTFVKMTSEAPSTVSGVPGYFSPLLFDKETKNTAEPSRPKRATSPKPGPSRLVEEKENRNQEEPGVSRKRKAKNDHEEAVQLIKEVYVPLLEEDNKNAQEEYKAMRTAFKLTPNPYKNQSLKPKPVNWHNEKFKVSKVQSSPAQPKTKHFVHIERSFQGQESLRLPNLPYIDDDYDCAKLVKELEALHPDGIHGFFKDWDKCSDHLLYKIMKSLEPKWKQSEKSANVFYRALYELFPNKFTLSQFETIWPKLLERFEGVKLNKDEKLTNAEAIKKYLCVKCRMYNCLIHKPGENPPKPKGTLIEQPIQRRACSKDCYIYFPDVDCADSDDSDDDCPIEKKHYLKVEIRPFKDPAIRSMFEKLINSNQNPCQLAKMVGTMEEPAMSCQELYRLIESTKKREESPERRKNPLIVYASLFHGSIDINKKIVHCDHEGECSKDREDCPCASNKLGCFKYCSCYIDCKMKYTGCKCAAGQCGTKYCPCFNAKRECDPELCGSCNSGTQYVYGKNPIPQDKENSEESPQAVEKLLPICLDTQLQRGAGKKVRVAKSQIAGNGLYIAEDAVKGDFIGEYVGEIISQEEADRRGKIYDAMGLSYTFNLNNEQVLDAYNFGNAMRFANHSQQNPNCGAKILLVDGEQRIGIFALVDIKKGEELLFNYGYESGWIKKYCNIEKGAAKTKK